MFKAIVIVAFVFVALTNPASAFAAEPGESHLPHNHIGAILGYAEEVQADGHREEGRLWGIEYVRQFHPRWGWGASFEQEGFGDNDQKRHGVLAFPVSYYIKPKWRVFAAPGIEYRGPGEPDKAMFRLGTGYNIPLGEHFTLSPEAQIDFIAGGTNVYVFALALGYGF